MAYVLCGEVSQVSVGKSTIKTVFKKEKTFSKIKAIHFREKMHTFYEKKP